MLGFASIYQVPMVGSDVCGFGGDTTETLCARWAMLGAFNPFYRNHNGDTSIPQEFYRWPLVTQAAKNAIDMRYRLLDYFYTAFHKQHMDGTPALQPLFFQYPQDTKTYDVQFQFLFGPSILVSPVLEENSTAVDIYLPDDRFYCFLTYKPVEGKGANVSLTDISYTEIPVHIKGGVVLPLRVESAFTTAELQKKDFELVVAPARDGSAYGSLYFDDGVSIEQKETPWEWAFEYKNGALKADGKGECKDVGKLKWAKVKILGVAEAPKGVEVDGKKVKEFTYDTTTGVVCVTVGKSLSNKSLKVELKY
jgi:alpha-glucosidase